MAIAGLCLNIVGTVMLFFFGFPQPHHDEGVSLGLEDGTSFGGTTVGEFVSRAQQRKVRYRRLAYLALTFLLIGFTLQLLDALDL